MAVIRATSNTKRIQLRVRRNKLDECCNNMALCITPLCCEQPQRREYDYNTCGDFVEIEKVSEPVLTLVYNLFDFDEQGRANFLLDDQFAELPCGRYNAELTACGCTIYCFQIDKRESVAVSHISTDDRNNCCEGKYGC